jgi:aspartate racemase
MKTIGILGGMSWESSAEYYRLINEEIAARLGGSHSAKCLLYSFDFHEMEGLQTAGRWKDATGLMIDAALALKGSGAQFLVIATNTMHKMADDVEAATGIPLLHIADAAGEAITQSPSRRIGLLGTSFTMEEPFYRERLERRYGLEVLIPEKADRETIHRVIYQELVAGKIVPQSKKEYQRIIALLVASGAEAILLACTEIGLLIKKNDCAVPLFDTTVIHAHAAVEYALEGSSRKSLRSMGEE